jgi:hypothetical protein
MAPFGVAAGFRSMRATDGLMIFRASTIATGARWE